MDGTTAYDSGPDSPVTEEAGIDASPTLDSGTTTVDSGTTPVDSGTTPVDSGTDSGAGPSCSCATQAATTCGTTGACDDAGACVMYASGTTCAAAACASGTATAASQCDGKGNCVAGASTSCAPYGCGATACSTSCTADTDCATGNYCDTKTSQCVPTLGVGTACTASDQCTMSNCVSGFCCNSACSGACQSCAGVQTLGANGTCGNVQESTQTSQCNGNNACDGQGGTSSDCKLKSGQPCTQSSQCATNVCLFAGDGGASGMVCL